MVERDEVCQEVREAAQRLIDRSAAIEADSFRYVELRTHATTLGEGIVTEIAAWCESYAGAHMLAKTKGHLAVRYLNEQLKLDDKPALASGYRVVALCVGTIRTYAARIPPEREKIIELARLEKAKPGCIAHWVAMGELHADVTTTQIRRLGKPVGSASAAVAQSLPTPGEPTTPSADDGPDDDEPLINSAADDSTIPLADGSVILREYVFVLRTEEDHEIDVDALQVKIAEVAKAFGLLMYLRNLDAHRTGRLTNAA